MTHVLQGFLRNLERRHARQKILIRTTHLLVVSCGMPHDASDTAGFQSVFRPICIGAVLGEEYKGGALGETVLPEVEHSHLPVTVHYWRGHQEDEYDKMHSLIHFVRALSDSRQTSFETVSRLGQRVVHQSKSDEPLHKVFCISTT